MFEKSTITFFIVDFLNHWIFNFFKSYIFFFTKFFYHRHFHYSFNLSKNNIFQFFLVVYVMIDFNLKFRIFEIQRRMSLNFENQHLKKQWKILVEKRNITQKQKRNAFKFEKTNKNFQKLLIKIRIEFAIAITKIVRCEKKLKRTRKKTKRKKFIVFQNVNFVRLIWLSIELTNNDDKMSFC